MPRRWREPAAIAAEINRIRSLRLDALRRQWRLVFGRMHPCGLSKDLLGRIIVARLQERAFGGLDRVSLRFLESLARYERPPRRQIKPGTVLVREYQGQRHTVTTAPEAASAQHPARCPGTEKRRLNPPRRESQTSSCFFYLQELASDIRLNPCDRIQDDLRD